MEDVMSSASKLSDAGGTPHNGSYAQDGSSKSAFGPEARTKANAGCKCGDGKKGKGK